MRGDRGFAGRGVPDLARGAEVKRPSYSRGLMYEKMVHCSA